LTSIRRRIFQPWLSEMDVDRDWGRRAKLA
jgi:hypothetical protein